MKFVGMHNLLFSNLYHLPKTFPLIYTNPPKAAKCYRFWGEKTKKTDHSVFFKILYCVGLPEMILAHTRVFHSYMNRFDYSLFLFWVFGCNYFKYAILGQASTIRIYAKAPQLDNYGLSAFKHQ